MLQFTDPEKLCNKEGSRLELHKSHCEEEIEWTSQVDGRCLDGVVGMGTCFWDMFLLPDYLMQP